MAQSKIERQQQAVLKAQQRLGVALANEEKKEGKLREARLIRLGVLVEQMFKGGDLQLLGRFEAVAAEQFKDRKFDRAAFELDAPLNYFDKLREDAMVAKAQQPDTTKAASSAAVASPPSSPSASKPTAGPASRPSSNGANGSNGASAASAPSSTASA